MYIPLRNYKIFEICRIKKFFNMENSQNFEIFYTVRQNKCRYRFFLLVLSISKYAETLFQVKIRLYSDLRIN